ncbi:hypothetical protein LTR62_000453 [Meristemomyces frigidus]|uniref:Complex 1 LYR protein domain-containing protein n=1 Tax=Meristemomyces frigidus TaxID=1508187 RepID=A0AAN7YSW3_9PEZI|nr:hypothetical protein LTR62_000453 [Meristemomyces frigidus]
MSLNFHLPRNSTPHRVAAIALYRALLSQCRVIPTAVQQRNELQNIVRNRFRQASHEQSKRRLILLFEAGYEAIDHLDAAVAGEEESRSYILDLLAKAPNKVKQSPPPAKPKAQPVQRLERPAGSPSLLDRPLPLEQLSGRRHVPVLFNAHGIPILRLKKPQPESLSGYINHRIQKKQKRHDTRHRLETELEFARAEDTWDHLIASHIPLGRSSRTSSEGGGKEDTWSYAPAMARREINDKLQDERNRNQAMGVKMQAVVDREQALFDVEKAARQNRGPKLQKTEVKDLSDLDKGPSI